MVEDYDHEYEDGVYSEWKSENLKELQNDFCDDNKQEFNVFLEEQVIDDTYDIEYWVNAYCEDNDDFQDYCKDEFNDYMDVFETQRSLWNDRR